MLRFYNTLTKEYESFQPMDPGVVKLYSCGPTVYDFAHLGNFRAYVFVDLLKRYLEYKEYNVNHIMNLTDVDDKTIKRSREKNQSLDEFTEFYSEAFIKDIKSLNIQMPDKIPKATEHIQEIVDLIKSLIDKAYAYKADDGSIYFDISKLEGYGRLAQLEKQELKQNADGRMNLSDEYSKEDLNDFVLWKAYREEDGDVYWQTDLGKGRPGWHVECSAMSMKYLGESFDIHTGGVDLVFPHHTNEIAQSEAATGKPFVKYWLHNNHLLVEGEKMSKSAGNFYTLRDVVDKGHNPLLIRFILLRTHYRKVLDFSFDDFEEVKSIASRIINFLLDLSEIKFRPSEVLDVGGVIEKNQESFIEAMDDDLNISSALASMFELISEINSQVQKLGPEEAQKVFDYIFELDQVFGFIGPLYRDYQERLNQALTDENNQKLIKERNEARRAKDYNTADNIREKLMANGLLIKDTPEGYQARLKDAVK